jgi:hypothetical protein
MKTLYEVLNVDLAQEYTKERKKEAATALNLDGDLHEKVFAAIDDMVIPNDDDRLHWIQKLGRAAGADLLTLGKVQPESMLAMASLSKEDFKEAVKIATSAARTWNEYTVSAEKDLNEETMPSTML